MKIFFTLISSFILTISGIAQPVISDIEPGIGDEYQIDIDVQDGFYSPGSAGMNINWDFSNLSTDGLFTFDMSVVNPSESVDFDDFPEATTALYRESGDSYMYEFYNYGDNTKSFMGNAGVGLGEDLYLDNPIDILTFPFTYLSNGSDTYTGITINPFLSETQIVGNVLYAADGYGTLETVYGSYTNVLRVSTVTEDIQTNILEDVNTTHTLNTSWYSPEYPVPVLTIDYIYSYLIEFETPNDTTFSDSLSIISYLVSYNGEATTIEEKSPENTLSIYPNPTSEYIVVNAEIEGKVSLKVFSADGKLVIEQLVQNQEKIYVNDLSSGYYIAILIKDGMPFKPTSFIVN